MHSAQNCFRITPDASKRCCNIITSSSLLFNCASYHTHTIPTRDLAYIKASPGRMMLSSNTRVTARIGGMLLETESASNSLVVVDLQPEAQRLGRACLNDHHEDKRENIPRARSMSMLGYDKDLPRPSRSIKKSGSNASLVDLMSFDKRAGRRRPAHKRAKSNQSLLEDGYCDKRGCNNGIAELDCDAHRHTRPSRSTRPKTSVASSSSRVMMPTDNEFRTTERRSASKSPAPGLMKRAGSLLSLRGGSKKTEECPNLRARAEWRRKALVCGNGRFESSPNLFA